MWDGWGYSRRQLLANAAIARAARMPCVGVPAMRRGVAVAASVASAAAATYAGREYAEAGGLMSYGASPLDGYRRGGARMSVAFSRERLPLTCRWCSRPNLSFASISKLPEYSA